MADPPPASATGTVRCEHCGDEHPVSFTHCPRTGKPVASGRALVGRVFAERYRILGVLGEGGMGTVYLAEHLLIGRKVALKRLHPELAGDAKAVARFQREARTAAATGHDNIVDVLDMGFAEDGAPFLVMEYLKGESLAQLLRREGSLPVARAAGIVGQVLAALWAVHRRGIVHRDLKPDNVFVLKRSGKSDYVKVVDFGISKMKKEDDGLALTRTGVTVGTPYYMSPEHARGVKDLDGRADLYGAGVILYECLSGRLPFQGSNYHALLQAILASTPPKIEDLAKDVPPALAAIVHKAIARAPRDRFQDAREMLLALVPFGAVDPGSEEVDSVAPPSGEVGLLDTEALRVTTAVDPKAVRLPATTAHVPPSGARPVEPTTTPPRESGETPMEEVVMRDGRVRYAVVPTGPQRGSVVQPTPPPATTTPPRARISTGRMALGATPPPITTPPVSAASPVPQAPPRARVVTGQRVASPSQSQGRTPSPASGADVETQVKGSLLVAAMEHVTQTRGKPVLERALRALTDDSRMLLQGLVMPVAWFPLSLYDSFLSTLERELGNGSGAIAQQLGAAAATRDMPTVHRAFMQGATPATVLDKLPALFRLYHQGGEARVEPAATAAWRVELRDLSPDSFFHAIALAGFFQQTLEIAGARDVRASVVGSRAHGDERTLIAVRYR